MNCREFREVVVELARGRPCSEEALAHAARCSGCAERLSEQRRLTAALRGLAAAHRQAQAPAWIEQALRSEFRGRALPWPAWAAVAAALLVGFALLRVSQPPAVTAPAEVATQFFPMLPGTDLKTLQPAGVIRVRVPRVTLTWYGLPMNPDRAAEPISADVVLDRDGVARAIRFVN